MLTVGGNTQVVIEKRATSGYNSIGEPVTSWVVTHTLNGFVDYLSGDYRRSESNAKTADSTHIFVGDFIDLSEVGESTHRLRQGDKVYDVSMIDNPMGMGLHLEIYLRYTGRD